jgi:hypothetical protein
MELMPFVLRNELGQQDISWRALEQEKLKSDIVLVSIWVVSCSHIIACSLSLWQLPESLWSSWKKRLKVTN